MTEGRGEKLQKYLADLAYGSRREMESWIADGRVTVNGVPAHVGQRVDADDRIRVDGKPVRARPADRCRVIVLNKPAGVICTRHDPEGRPTVFDRLPAHFVGRSVSESRPGAATGHPDAEPLFVVVPPLADNVRSRLREGCPPEFRRE